ncbi:MAG: hypothetical protein GY820_20790 [Gammaproteobacteria bacterium]|nr:hypothetical protein [Gammaproteobacteria bacterium]
MSLATARIPVLMTPDEKKGIVKKAEKAGMPTSQFMRLAAENYQPSKDDEALSVMLEEMNVATSNMNRSIDNCLAYVEESNKRIALMELEAKQ